MKMEKNPYAPEFENLPETLIVFPLSGVLLLPTGQLPLNIFEPRYKQMIDDAMAGNKLIGIIQPRDDLGSDEDLYNVGCVGKITEYSETRDERYMITLTGICRFGNDEELGVETPYRQVRPNWQSYQCDLEKSGCRNLDRTKLHDLLKSYFDAQELSCDWETVESTTDAKLITCLSMVCPFSAKEKQALLEAACINERAKTFMAMLEMAFHGTAKGEKSPSKH